MSILIKGMKMPKCCVECEWHEYYGGDYDWVHACRRTGTMPIGNADTERANDCPLVEIPEPHGDLIDRDALVKDLTNGIKAGLLLDGYEKYQNINDMDDCVECVKYTDAVIEAEGSENNEHTD